MGLRDRVLSGLAALGRQSVHDRISILHLWTYTLVPREQKMLEGHLPRVIYHGVYQYAKILMEPLKSRASLPRFDSCPLQEEGRYKATWKRRFKLPGRKAGLIKSTR